MEIRLENDKETFEIHFRDKEINGIIGTNQEEIVNKICLKNKRKTKIMIDKKELSKQEEKKYKEKIKIVEENINIFYFQYKVYEYLYYEIKRSLIPFENPKKKIIDTLKIVGLDITYLNKNIKDLSSSERKLLQIGVALMFNPEIIVMVEPFQYFDRKIERRMIILFQKMKEFYDKTIILISKDANMIYKYTNYLIIEKNHKILLETETKEIYQKVDFLMENKIELPDIVEFTYLARKRGAKIDYHKDLRDLIKDIYKHV